MNFQDAKSVLLQNNKIKESFGKRDLNDLKIHVGLQILELRLIKNYTQKQLAKKIGTAQPSIARAERGAALPSLSFMHKIAAAAGTELIPPKFAVVESTEIRYQINNLPSNSIQNIRPSKAFTKNVELTSERFSHEKKEFVLQVSQLQNS